MKTYITINLNKAESAETRKERIREQTRWAVFAGDECSRLDDQHRI